MRGYSSDRRAADELALVLSTYRKHESGERGEGGLKEHHLKRYSRAFQVSQTWLATGDGHPTRPVISDLTEEEARVIEALRAAKRA